MDLCLLEHDLRNPYFIGVGGFAPRKAAAVASVPSG